MAYCIAAVDGQITNNEWQAIKEGLSFVNLSPDTFNDAIEDLDSFDMDQLNSELHSLSAFLHDNADDETAEQRDARMAWWREARFGLFIHWGIYSIPAGTHKGEQIENLSLIHI